MFGNPEKGIARDEIDVLQEGLPQAIPLEMCYLGWQESLAQLAKLVEPEIATSGNSRGGYEG